MGILLEIKRFENESNLPNRGIIFINRKFFGYTMERPNLNNKPYFSRINAGTYIAKKVHSKDRGYFWLLMNVKDRTEIILFHPGSYMENFLGCIGCGERLHETKKGRRMILQTRKQCKRFMEITKDERRLTVIIT